MCGIAGIVDLKQPEQVMNYLPEMRDIVHHRGPDDGGLAYFSIEGKHCAENEVSKTDTEKFPIGLAHRRLSIIDLTACGHQPMCDASGRYWIVYNGEVYNYLELRSELESLGHQFKSRSDTEVILQAYIRWGAECLTRFNGMWAFAIFDSQARQVFCARDRFGVKPLHYAVSPGRFAFASEVKQLLSLPWVDRQANFARLADFFQWGFENHTNDTYFQQVHCLPPSHYATIDLSGVQSCQLDVRKYWEPTPREELEEQAAIDRFRELLIDAVRLRLRSDVPIGFTLSGGLDSSSVIGVAGSLRDSSGQAEGLTAFNVEFEGNGYSERPFAEAAASNAKARMVVLQPKKSDLEQDWNQFIWHVETPVGGLSYFSNYQIYKLIRSHGISVVISGQGGDELLLGYERYRAFHNLFELRRGQIVSVIRNAMQARNRANLSLKQQLLHSIYFSMPSVRAVGRGRKTRDYLTPSFHRQSTSDREHLVRSMRHSTRASLQKSEFLYYQLPHLLHFEDRVSMAHSVESRHPFLDYRLLELVLGQKSDLLYRNGWSKYILRQAVDKLVPAEVTQRTDKMGYETPTGRLLNEVSGIFKPLLDRHRDDPIINVPTISKMLDSNSGDERLMCSALGYLAWKETFGVLL